MSLMDKKQTHNSKSNALPSFKLPPLPYHTNNNQHAKPAKIRKNVQQQNEDADDQKEDMTQIVNLVGSKHKYVKVQYGNSKSVSIRFSKKDSMQGKMDKIKERIAKKFNLTHYVLTLKDDIIRMDDIDKFCEILAVSTENSIVFTVQQPHHQNNPQSKVESDSQLKILIKFNNSEKSFPFSSDSESWTDEMLDALKKTAKRRFGISNKQKISFYDEEVDDDPLDDIEDLRTIYDDVEDKNNFTLLMKIRHDLSRSDDDSEDENDKRAMQARLEKAERENQKLLKAAEAEKQRRERERIEKEKEEKERQERMRREKVEREKKRKQEVQNKILRHHQSVAKKILKPIRCVINVSEGTDLFKVCIECLNKIRPEHPGQNVENEKKLIFWTNYAMLCLLTRNVQHCINERVRVIPELHANNILMDGADFQRQQDKLKQIVTQYHQHLSDKHDDEMFFTNALISCSEIKLDSIPFEMMPSDQVQINDEEVYDEKELMDIADKARQKGDKEDSSVRVYLLSPYPLCKTLLVLPQVDMNMCSMKLVSNENPNLYYFDLPYVPWHGYHTQTRIEFKCNTDAGWYVIYHYALSCIVHII